MNPGHSPLRPFDRGENVVEGPLVYKDSVIISLVGLYETFAYPIPDCTLCYSVPLRHFGNGWAYVNIVTHWGVPPCYNSAGRVDHPLALFLASLSSLVLSFIGEFWLNSPQVVPIQFETIFAYENLKRGLVRLGQ